MNAQSNSQMAAKIRAVFADDRQARRWIFFLTAGFALLFTLSTNHIWEDWFGTYRVSRNLVRGDGLVFTPGEKLHTFTSPFQVLLPAFLCVVTGNSSDMLVLWLFRFINFGLLGLTAVWLWEIGKQQKLAGFALAAVVAMFALDAKTVDFSINGMETGFVVLFMTMTVRAMVIPTRRQYLQLGLAWAGLMWARPDSCVYIALMGIGFFLFPVNREITPDRKSVVKLCLRAALVTTAAYLPWFIWSWVYFGSPVPHTIAAKGLSMPEVSAASWVWTVIQMPLEVFSPTSTVRHTFEPAYSSFGGWHHSVAAYGQSVAIICALYFLFPLGRPLGRALSFMFIGGHFYLSHFMPHPFPWYIPITTVLAIMVIGQILQQGANLAARLGSANPDDASRQLTLRRMVVGIACGLVAAQLILSLCVTYQMAVQQEIIELGNRKKVGLWLRDNAKSRKETVFLEPIGYIGYYSDLKLYDYPGLTSREMIEARKKHPSDEFGLLIGELEPDWLVLRPGEAEGIHRKHPKLLMETYQLAKAFDVTDVVAALGSMPGKPYLEVDQTFLVFKRQTTPAPR